MKRKANEPASDLPSPKHPSGYAVRGAPKQNTTEHYDKLLKLFDTKALDCQLKELLEQKQSDSETSEIEEENIKYYSLVPTSIKNEPYPPYDSSKMPADARAIDNRIDNDSSSPTNITDDVLRHIPASSTIKFKGVLGLSSSVSQASSAPTSVNGSVTTKTSSPYTSSNNSLISDEDDDSLVLNFDVSDIDDDPDFNNFDSDPDVTTPLSDDVIGRFFPINEAYRSKLTSGNVQDTIDFINNLHFANMKDGRNGRLSFRNAEKKKLRSKKRLSALKTEETLKGALSTFKTPLLLPSLAPEKHIKSEVSNPKSISKRKAKEKIPSMPAKKKRKKKTNSDTTSLTDQVLDVNTSHSTFSLDSYFFDEMEIPSSSKPRSASSTSSLDNKLAKNSNISLKSNAKSRKTLQQLNSRRRSIYISICKNEIPKASERRARDIVAKSEVLSERAIIVLKELKHKVLKPVVKPSESPVLEKRIEIDTEMHCDKHNLEDIARLENENNEEKHLKIIPTQFMEGIEEVLEKSTVFKEEIIYCDLSRRQHLANSWIRQQILPEHLLMLCSESENESQIAEDYIVQLARRFRKVCNHPQLIQSKEIRTPFWQKGFVRYPKILSEFTDKDKQNRLLDKFSIYHPDQINRSLFCRRRGQIDDLHVSDWSFLRLMGVNLSALYDVHFGDFGSSLRLVQEIQRASELSLKEWESDKSSSSLTILTDVERKTSPINILKSELLQGLVFTSLTEDLYGYLEQKMFDYYNAKTKNHEPKETSHLLRTGLPAFLYCVLPKVITERSYNLDPPSSADVRNLEVVLTSPIQQHVLGGFDIFSSKIALMDFKLKPDLSCSKLVTTGQQNVFIDSGKLMALSRLLQKLDEKRSRVIIYCHVQRMTRIIEEYLKKQSWSYLNLDYLSQFQQNRNESPDCFIYLASRKSLLTEVNTFSVDTVIFYDKELSLVEKQTSERLLSQLMQGGQITIYRLVSKDGFEQQTDKGELDGIQKVALNLIHGDKYLENQRQILEKFLLTGHSELRTDGNTIPDAEHVNKAQRKKCKNLIEEIADSSDSDTDFDSIIQPGNPSLQGPRFLSKISRGTSNLLGAGTRRRGRPPTRLRFRSRDIEADGGRRPGRPRLKRFGPINQGTRGRRPGRPRKSDASISSVSSNTASDVTRSIDLEQEMSQDAYSIEAVSSV